MNWLRVQTYTLTLSLFCFALIDCSLFLFCFGLYSLNERERERKKFILYTTATPTSRLVLVLDDGGWLVDLVFVDGLNNLFFLIAIFFLSRFVVLVATKVEVSIFFSKISNFFYFSLIFNVYCSYIFIFSSKKNLNFFCCSKMHTGLFCNRTRIIILNQSSANNHNNNNNNKIVSSL